MRISDWSSDVCSSDLLSNGCRSRVGSRWERDGWRFAAGSPRDLLARRLSTLARPHDLLVQGQAAYSVLDAPGEWAQVGDPLQRSEERRVENECVSTCNYRWSPSN